MAIPLADDCVSFIAALPQHSAESLALSGISKADYKGIVTGSLNRHYLSVLDEKGNEIQETSFELKDGKVRSKNS